MHKKYLKTVILIVFLALVFSVMALVLFDITIFPSVKNMAFQRAKAKTEYIIHECVSHILEKDKSEYQNLVSFEKNEEGKIVAMKTDSVGMNKLKSSVVIDVQKSISSYSHDDMFIHLGNFVGGGFFSGKGPKIKFCVKPFGAVSCDYRNVFESAGINQTNHRVMLDVSVSVYIILPTKSTYETITTSVCISDTIIVGDVPQAFTNVQNFSADDEGETVADEIIDFGAHNHLQ